MQRRALDTPVTAWNQESMALLAVMCRYGVDMQADQAEPGSFTENNYAVSLSPGGTCLIWLLGNVPLQVCSHAPP